MSIPTPAPVSYTTGGAVTSADGTRITYLAIGPGAADSAPVFASPRGRRGIRPR